MLQGMDQSEFGQFVAALWERQGWQTQVKNDDGRVFVAAQRPETGEEGLLWAVAGTGEVGGKQVQQFASLCKEYGVEESAVVTAGTVSDHAEKVAESAGVELLDGDGVTAFLRQRGLTDLPKQYGGGGGTDADRSDAPDDGDSPLDRLRAVGERVAATVGSADLPVSGTVVLAVVVGVALLAGGVLYGPSVPFLGGDGPISAESTAPEDSATTLHVAWNATVVDSIDPNESDGKAYYPPQGEQFVLVRLSVNNTGEQKVPLKQSAFRLRTDDRTYGHQPLVGLDGFLDFAISPGQRYVGWTVFSVPEGTTGTLVYDQNATGPTVAVEFEHDPDLPAVVARQ